MFRAVLSTVSGEVSQPNLRILTLLPGHSESKPGHSPVCSTHSGWGCQAYERRTWGRIRLRAGSRLCGRAWPWLPVQSPQGERGDQERANDNGEPSGTAGKPILGQIHSKELTNVLVIVVRYFGGVKLGTSGLIVAYRAAAAEALEAVEHVEKTINGEIILKFSYPLLNEVLRIVKEEEPKVVEQVFDNDCLVRLSMRLSRLPRLVERYEKLVIASKNDLKIDYPE